MWLMRQALDQILDKLGEQAKANVILDLEKAGVYNSQAEYLDATRLYNVLSDLFGIEAATLFFENAILEMDKIKSI